MTETSANIQRLVARHPFPGADPAGLQELLHQGDEKYLQEHTVLCGEGQPSDSMYVLLDGQIEVTRKDNSGQPRVLTVLHAPALVGHMGLIDGSNRSATCRAKTDLRVIQFTRARYHDFVEDQSRLGATLRRLLCSSLSGQLTGGNARVHALLSEIAPSEVTDKMGHADDITREDLRQAAGVLEGWKVDTAGAAEVESVETEESAQKECTKGKTQREREREKCEKRTWSYSVRSLFLLFLSLTTTTRLFPANR